MSEVETIKNQVRRVSFSQYAMWSTCKHQWKLAYVDKLKPQDNSIHLIFGSAIHEAIQTWAEKYYDSDASKERHFDMHELFKIRLMELFKEGIVTHEDGTKSYVCDRTTLEEFYLDGITILDYVRKHRKTLLYKGAGTKLVGCEIPLEVQLRPTVQFVGYIDMVVHHPREKRIIIYDFKTSKKGWYSEKKDPKKLNQLLLYKRFYSTVFEVPEEQIEVKFMILKRKVSEYSAYANPRAVNFEPANGTPSVNKAVASFENFVDTTFDEHGNVKLENLIPEPSADHCRWCPFKQNKTLCPTGYYE